MAADLQHRTYDTGRRICTASSVRRIYGDVSRSHPARCNLGSGASVFSQAVAILFSQKRMDSQRYLVFVV